MYPTHVHLDYHQQKTMLLFRHLMLLIHVDTISIIFWEGLDNLFLPLDFVKNGVCSKNRRER
jgi:hypothetical protein